MKEIPFRNDQYGRNFYIEKNDKEKLIPYKNGITVLKDLKIEVKEIEKEDYLKIDIDIKGKALEHASILGFRLGINTCMESFPKWNKTFFPTAMRCEKNGFYSLFKTPEGEMLSVCSPDKIRSWRNEYAKLPSGDVGHRIYTSSIEFLNRHKQPVRHPENPKESISCSLFYFYSETDSELKSKINKFSGIKIPKINRYTLQPCETLLIDNEPYEKPLKQGINLIKRNGNADLTVFVREPWFYYLKSGAKAAENCQQKPGSHCESYYGLFTMVEYGKIIKNPEYTKKVAKIFDELIDTMTIKGFLKPKACPHRLQNVSTLISLSADFYELTNDLKYLEIGNKFSTWLMHLQWKDGSYRNFGIHYTCVIYPAKSMLEFSIAEKEAYKKTKKRKYLRRSKKHYKSAEKAIDNLIYLKDNIETEGQSTFEDGMISCEFLQIAYLALLTNDEKKKEKAISTAEYLLKKHRCLEQTLIPDCRIRNCTLRFWEARYDINYFQNMLSSPHGWTSWKNYGIYYLYILTGKYEYLNDLMDTMGACMQCVDKDGNLNWAFVPDPYIKGKSLCKKECSFEKAGFCIRETGETYLPVISDWYRQNPKKLVWQYIRHPGIPIFKKLDYGGSCDNNVHEHFKCLAETVFGKAFIHEKENGEIETYNCVINNNVFSTDDPFVKTIIYRSLNKKDYVLNGKAIKLEKGINIIDL